MLLKLCFLGNLSISLEASRAVAETALFGGVLLVCRFLNFSKKRSPTCDDNWCWGGGRAWLLRPTNDWNGSTLHGESLRIQCYQWIDNTHIFWIKYLNLRFMSSLEPQHLLTSIASVLSYLEPWHVYWMHLRCWVFWLWQHGISIWPPLVFLLFGSLASNGLSLPPWPTRLRNSVNSVLEVAWSSDMWSNLWKYSGKFMKIFKNCCQMATWQSSLLKFPAPLELHWRPWTWLAPQSWWRLDSWCPFVLLTSHHWRYRW